MFWWIVGFIVGLPVIAVVVSALLGFTTNPKTTGKALLKKKLKQRGFDLSSFPEHLLDEVKIDAVNVAQMRKDLGHSHFNNALVEHIDGCIELLTTYLRGEIDEFDQKSSLIKRFDQTIPHLRGSAKI